VGVEGSGKELVETLEKYRQSAKGIENHGMVVITHG